MFGNMKKVLLGVTLIGGVMSGSCWGSESVSTTDNSEHFEINVKINIPQSYPYANYIDQNTFQQEMQKEVKQKLNSVMHTIETANQRITQQNLSTIYSASLKWVFGSNCEKVENMIKDYLFTSKEATFQDVKNFLANLKSLADKNKTAVEKLMSLSSIRLDTEGYRLIGEKYNYEKNKEEWKKLILTRYLGEYILKGVIDIEELNYDLQIYFQDSM